MTKPLETTLKARIEATEHDIRMLSKIASTQSASIDELRNGDYFDEWMKRWKAMQTPMGAEEDMPVPTVDFMPGPVDFMTGAPNFMSGELIELKPDPASRVWPIVLAFILGVAVGMVTAWVAGVWWMGPNNIGSHGKPLSYESAPAQVLPKPASPLLKAGECSMPTGENTWRVWKERKDGACYTEDSGAGSIGFIDMGSTQVTTPCVEDANHQGNWVCQ